MQATRWTICTIALLMGASIPAPAEQSEASQSERASEIEAKCWFNAQPVRIHESPRLILLEFWSIGSRESRKFVKPLTRLYERYNDGRLLVVALSEDKCEDVRNFIRRETIKYKVGGETKSADDYKVKELPAIFLVAPEKSQIVAHWAGREVDITAIAKAIKNFLGPPPGAASSTSTGALQPEEMETYWAEVEEHGDKLASLTDQILASSDREILAEAIAPLDEYYRANLPDDPASEIRRGMIRSQGLSGRLVLHL